MPFDDFWRRLTNALRDEQLIRNWTFDNGYLNRGDFTAVYRGGNFIECSPPDAKYIQRVPKEDFQFMYEKLAELYHRKS